MKRNATFKPYLTPERIAAAIAAAPERVEDPDCPYDPNDQAAVDAFWSGPDVIASRSRSELQERLSARRRRGPGRRPAKVSTTIRFDPDVLAAMKATGPGWQTRVNDLVKDWIQARQNRE